MKKKDYGADWKNQSAGPLELTGTGLKFLIGLLGYLLPGTIDPYRIRIAS
ncbi:hypothetical protein [Chitinimonas sp. JJ19]|nr:hypothetical protein [Chitinimonas sp.]